MTAVRIACLLVDQFIIPCGPWLDKRKIPGFRDSLAKRGTARKIRTVPILGLCSGVPAYPIAEAKSGRENPFMGETWRKSARVPDRSIVLETERHSVQFFAYNEEIACSAAHGRQQHDNKADDGGIAFNASLRQDLGSVVGGSIALDNGVVCGRASAGHGSGIVVTCGIPGGRPWWGPQTPGQCWP